MKKLVSLLIVFTLVFPLLFACPGYATDVQKTGTPFEFTAGLAADGEILTTFNLLNAGTERIEIFISAEGQKEPAYSNAIKGDQKETVISGLKPDTNYIFNVNIQNENGITDSFTGKLYIAVKKNDKEKKFSDVKVKMDILEKSSIDSEKIKASAPKETKSVTDPKDKKLEQPMDVMIASTRYEVESNNTPGLADTFYDDDDVYGTISSTSDVDYFKIQFTSSGNANFFLGNIPSGCDYDLKLLDSNGTTVLRSSVNGSNANELISQYPVSAYKWYYLEVYPYSGSSSSYYLLRAKNYTTTSGDRYEYNDTSSNATSISSNTTITDANIHSTTDIDYFKFTLGGTSNVTVQLSNIPSGCDYDVQLYDSSFNVKGSGTNGGNSSENVSVTLSAGTYYIKVYSYTGSSTSYYRLQVTAQTAVAGDRYEPNGTTGIATSISSSTTIYDANINATTDIDYYKFTLNSAASVSVQLYNIPSGCDYDLKLYDSSNTQKGSSTAGSNTSENITVTLYAGTYYIKVYSYSGSSSSNYSLSVSTSSTSWLTVKGYIKPYLKTSHISGEIAVQVPLSGFKVKVIDDDGLFDSEIATIYTNSSGYFETTVSNDLSENGYDIYLRLELDDDKTVIKRGLLQSTYSWESSIRNNVIDRTLDFGVVSPTTTTSEEIEGAFSIWYWINYAHNYYRQNSYNGTTLPKLTVYWQKGEDAGSYYDWLGAMRIAGRNDAGDANNGDQYNPTIILHEYGHFIMDKNNCRPDNDGGTHYFNSPSNPGTAYSEGWASFFAMSSKNTTLYKDTESSGWFGADFENASYYNFGANPSPISLPKDSSSYSNNQSYELNVGAVMLDLSDSNNEGRDTVTKGFGSVDKTVLSKNNGIYDFYDEWMLNNYTNGIREQSWNLFDNRYVAHDMTIPWASIQSTSTGPYTYSGSQSYDDIAIKKYEWVIDRWTNIKTGYTQPDTVTFDPKALGLSTGWHTLSLFCYDPEGLKPASDRVRYEDFGVTDSSFWVDNTTTASQVNSMMLSNTEPTVVVTEGSQTDKQDLRNIDFYYYELSKQIPGTEKVSLEQKGILEYQKPVKYSVYLDEASDINVYSHIVGPFESLVIYDPNGVAVRNYDKAYPRKAIYIENAAPGEWQFELIPSKLLTQTDEAIPFALFVTTRPSSVMLDFPEITNSKYIVLEGELNGAETLEVKINGNVKAFDCGNDKYKGRIELQEGLNEISVTKCKGSFKSKSINKFITLDTTSPEIRVFDTNDGNIKTDAEIYTLDGIVSSDTKIVSINGERVCLGEFVKGFSLDVGLKDGLNAFEIEAVDYAGNVSKKIVNIIKE